MERLMQEPETVLQPEYAALIRQQDERPDQKVRFKDTIYSEDWASVLWQEPAKEARRFFEERLTGKPLVDLGGGIGWMTGFANELRVGKYINVDRNHHKDLPSDPHKIINSGPLGINIQADMLDFVARLKDGVANFAINGVNQEAINDERYVEALAKEVMRATQNGGLIFGIRSGVLAKISRTLDNENSAFREVDLGKETGFRVKTRSSQYIFERTA